MYEVRIPIDLPDGVNPGAADIEACIPYLTENPPEGGRPVRIHVVEDVGSWVIFEMPGDPPPLRAVPRPPGP
ncbi:hypothetical protein [Mycobacteroides abscessus]|uniref:hypothetical protein n=1 Tax=Mycobacteroides abscessus TaxID=36809 RepID=UPI0019D1A318|nr:hypothetical protein [Mycobacteroides abscessus]MBN7296610.1 hypothetical protein [Mycobacteroides abscessus subsp. abscessus]